MRELAVAIIVTALTAANAAANPRDAEALDHLDRGIGAYRIGDYAVARRELGLAIELAPDRANAYRWRAMTEEKQGDCPDAVVDVEGFLSRTAAGDDRVAEMIALRDRCVVIARAAPTVSIGVAATSPAGTSRDRPVYARWWFWPAVGAIVLTAAGVTYAITRDRESTLPSVHCDPSGCRP